MSSADTPDPYLLATLDPDDRAAVTGTDMSAEDRAELEAIAKRGTDVEDDGAGDDGDDADPAAAPVEGKGAADDEAPAPAAAAPAAAPAPAPAAAAPAPAAAAAAPAPAPAAEAEPEPDAFVATLPDDFDQQVAAVKEARNALRAQFKAGEIEFDEYTAQNDALSEQAKELEKIQLKYELSTESREQKYQNQWTAKIGKLFVAAKGEGIDYVGNEEQRKDLDDFVKRLAAKPENGDKSMDWFLQEGHKRVKALHGVTASAPAPAAAAPAPSPAAAKAAAVAARKAPLDAAPPSLSQVPGGDGPGDVGSEFADIDSLEGEAYEQAVARLAANPQAREKFAKLH